MDITLERILSLLPKNENGKFKHGAQKEFAQSIGYASGDIVSIWLSGTSESYKNKLHEIAAKYHVSVEWLRGETDIKTSPAVNAEDDELAEYLEMLRTRPECRMLLQTMKGASKAEVEANVRFIEELRGYKHDD